MLRVCEQETPGSPGVAGAWGVALKGECWNGSWMVRLGKLASHCVDARGYPMTVAGKRSTALSEADASAVVVPDSPRASRSAVNLRYSSTIVLSHGGLTQENAKRVSLEDGKLSSESFGGRARGSRARLRSAARATPRCPKRRLRFSHAALDAPNALPLHIRTDEGHSWTSVDRRPSGSGDSPGRIAIHRVAGRPDVQGPPMAAAEPHRGGLLAVCGGPLASWSSPVLHGLNRTACACAGSPTGDAVPTISPRLSMPVASRITQPAPVVGSSSVFRFTACS